MYINGDTRKDRDTKLGDPRERDKSHEDRDREEE